MTTSTETTGTYGPLKPDRIAAIEKLGVAITWGYEYVGKVDAGRHRVERDLTHDHPVIESVHLPFTPAQWWAMTTRDGEQYIGPCCGNTGYVQDVFAGVYREGGFISASEFLNAAHMIVDHEGFETWGPVDDEKFDNYIKSWTAATNDPEVASRLDLWAIIGVIYNAVEPGLQPSFLTDTSPSYPEPDPWRRNIRTLSGSVQHLAYADLFTETMPVEGGYSSEEAYETALQNWRMKDQQHAGQRVVNLAKLAPLMRDLVALIGDEHPRFDGYAIVDPDNNVLSNGYGLCLYRDRVQAQRVIELWARMNQEDTRGDREPRAPTEAEIVTCTVDVEHGLKLRS